MKQDLHYRQLEELWVKLNILKSFCNQSGLSGCEKVKQPSKAGFFICPFYMLMKPILISSQKDSAWHTSALSVV